MLREIARKKDTDCSEFKPFSEKIRFVGVTFNNFTPIDIDESCGFVESTRTTLLRLYYALFTKDIDWRDCCLKFKNFLDQNCDLKFKKELQDLIEEHYKKKNEKLVVLFDEISKIDNLKNSAVTSDWVRRYVSEICDMKTYFHACIFSVSDFELIDTESILTPGANRPVICIGKLPPLTKEQTLTLLAPAIEGLFTCE